MRYIHCLLLFIVLILCGCKADKLRESSKPSTEKPGDSGVLIEGRVGPFGVENGLVSLHPITEDGVDFSSAIGNVLTNSSGEFRLMLDNHHSGNPMLLRVYIDKDSTSLKCLLLAGCSGVPFGENYSPEVSFEMYLAVPELHAEARYSITPLSHIAFKLIEESVLSPIPSANGVERAQRSYVIAQSNSRVANRFGIAGELTSVPFADFTNDDEIHTASDASVRISMLAAGVIQAASKVYETSSTEGTLQRLSTQFLELGMPGVADLTFVVDHVAVLRESSSIASAVQSLYERDLGGLISEFDALMYHVAMEEAGLYSQGASSETLGLTPVEKAKSLVADVRQVSTSIDLQKIIALSSFSAIVDGGAGDALNQLGFSFNSLELINDSHFDHVLKAVGLTIEAAFSALVDYYGKSIISTNYEGLNFTHAMTQGIHSFGFNTVYDACEAQEVDCSVIYNLNVTFRVVSFTGNATTFAPGVLDYHIVGSVASGGLRLSFHEAGQQVRFIKPIISAPEHEYDENTNLYWVAANALRIRLPFELIKENGSAYEAMKGLIAMDSGKFNIEYMSSDARTAEEDGTISAVGLSEIKIEQLEGLKVNFSSVAQPGQGEAFRGSINLTQSFKPVVEPVLIKYNTVEHCGDFYAVECEEVNSEVFIEGETPENFLGIYASIGVEATLKGMLAPAFIELSGVRSSPDINNVNSLRMSYPGHAVAMNGRFSRNGIIALDAVNLDGMHLYFDTIQGRRTGVVESSVRDVAADIVDMGQWVKIQYINGDFESL